MRRLTAVLLAALVLTASGCGSSNPSVVERCRRI